MLFQMDSVSPEKRGWVMAVLVDIDAKAEGYGYTRQAAGSRNINGNKRGGSGGKVIGVDTDALADILCWVFLAGAVFYYLFSSKNRADKIDDAAGNDASTTGESKDGSRTRTGGLEGKSGKGLEN
jgi:hypothetical protein